MELAEGVAIGLLVGMPVIVTVAFGLGFASIASVTDIWSNVSKVARRCLAASFVT